MKICIVGAGAAGLCAIRHAVSFNTDVTAFEQNDKVGGTWIYSDDIVKDKYGNEIHSSMYESLHTNLPKEVMKFPDFPFPSQPKSYIPAKDVNDYLNSYADHFGLLKFIKFSHYVLRIRPISNGKWEVIVKNLLLSTAGYEILLFDAVFVCNGHFSTPCYPDLRGHEKFLGVQTHSHEYRKPEKFSNRTVLVIGGGPSGVDISQDIVKCALKVFWSHHQTTQRTFEIENFIQKPDVEQLTEKGAEFVDGSIEEIDEIVYCTGYKFTFPFLSVDCGLATDENYVRPLYKHCININQPSLAVIGLHSQVCPFQLFDLQVRFSLTFMTGQKPFPSKDEMIRDTEFDMNERWERGLSKKKAHWLGKIHQEKYFADLASTAQIDPIKPVILKMYNESHQHKSQDFHNYRQYKFTVLDDENFISEKVV
jgi:dimethylaniline monooxygenase (N-oxide forming)